MIILLHASFFKDHEDSFLELVLLEFLFHTLDKAVVILFVRERILNITYFAVGAAHERLNEKFSASLVSLSDGVASLHQKRILIFETSADMLGDVDTLAFRARLDERLVIGAQLHHLIMSQAW
ncbi:hypothetical protein HG530_002123 [Fusarium avenaceum]|nr:hypothetical protein HG530_002123 [Fusarium avenaceum]